eukprot:jgi/Hompol1/3824/HPOL_006761-RA
MAHPTEASPPQLQLTGSNRIALFELFVGAASLPPEDNFEAFRKLCFA